MKLALVSSGFTRLDIVYARLVPDATAAFSETARLGLGVLYLYTRNEATERLYAKLGWVVLERLLYNGRAATIMKRKITAADG